MSDDTVWTYIAGLDGADVLDGIRDWLTSYVAYPSEHAATAITLWAAHTHVVDAFDSTPRLALLSPEKRCGKSHTLTLLSTITAGAENLLDTSASFMFRRISAAHAEPAEPVTVLLDECDAVWNGHSSESSEALRAIINAGHYKGAVVGRVDTSAGNRLLRFPVYAPVALAGIGNLPDTILDRSVIIHMRRRADDEHIRDFRQRVIRPEGAWHHERLLSWLYDVRDQFGCAACWPELPPNVTDRAADSWEPLIAIADAAGGDWPKRARDACLSLLDAAQDDTISIGIKLLTDLRLIFAQFGDPVALHSLVIVAALNSMDDSPWGDWYGKPFRQNDLARLLKPFQLRDPHTDQPVPRNVRAGASNSVAKGYTRAAFADTWRRYGIPEPGPAVTGVTSVTALISNVTPVTPVTPPEGVDEHKQAQLLIADVLGGVTIGERKERK
jgi:hypothetical protein